MSDIGWDIPGWDWNDGDYSWLASRSGLHELLPDGTRRSVFFIHGGRIREQVHLPHGYHTPAQFAALVAKRATGLDDPRVVWMSDTGGGDADLWVEGTRPPNDSDVARLVAARKRQRDEDVRDLVAIQLRQAAWGKA